MELTEMKKELNSYLDHIRLANDRFIALQSIYDSISKYNTEINYAYGFFTVSIYAIADSCLSELVKLYCGSGDEKTLRKLINIINANQHLFQKEITKNYIDGIDDKIAFTETESVDIQAELKKAEDGLEGFSKIISNLTNRRNQYLAHNDPKYFYSFDGLTMDFPISLDDLSKLIQFAGNFCNSMQGLLDGEIVAYKTIGSDDLPNLFERLREMSSSETI